MKQYKLSTVRGKQLYDMGVNVDGVVCTTYMKNGQPQKNTLLTGAGSNI